MTSFAAWRSRRSVTAAAAKPFRDELLSSDRLEERALALAANLVVDPHPGRRAADPSRGSRTTCGCCGPATAPSPRTSAAASSSQPQLTGCSIISTWSRRDLGHSAEPAAELLPHAAGGGVADARRPGAYLRHGRRAGPPQRQPPRSAAARPVPEQLSTRRAVHDWRAVGLAEHVEARADRESPSAGRRTDGRAEARRAADAYVSKYR